MWNSLGGYTNNQMDVFGRFFGKRPLVRTCPHCGIKMVEEEMMKHVRECYSSSFRAATDEYDSEYRGSLRQMNTAMKQFEDDDKKNSSKSTNRNEQTNPNMSVGEDLHPKSQKGVDGNEQANYNMLTDNNSITKAQKTVV